MVVNSTVEPAIVKPYVKPYAWHRLLAVPILIQAKVLFHQFRRAYT